MLGSSDDDGRHQDDCRDDVVELLNALLQRSESHPHDADTLTRIGVLLFEPLHRPEEALQYLQRAVEADPANVDALFWTAKVLFHEFLDYDATANMLEKALALCPDRPDCLSLLASVVLGTVADPVCAHRKALEYVLEALNHEQGWPALWEQGAISLRVLGRRREAREFARKGLLAMALPVHPRDPVDEYYEEVITGRLSAVALENLTRQASI